MGNDRLRAALWVLICLCLCARGMFADETNGTPSAVPVVRAEQPIKIDGVLDDAAWQTAVPVRVIYAWGKVGQASEEPRMIVKYAWDDNYLYLGYETFDKNLVALPTDDMEGPPKNQRRGARISDPNEKVDVVEFFVSFGDQRFFWELHHNAANQFNDLWCAMVDDLGPITKQTIARYGIYFGNREIVQDDADAGCTLAMASRSKIKPDGSPSTLNDSSDVDTGYTGELRLPWLGLGAPTDRETFVTLDSAQPNGPKRRMHGPWKMAGQEMLILSVFQDGDLKDHYHHASPTFPGGWFHKGAAHWPRYRLEEPAAR